MKKKAPAEEDAPVIERIEFVMIVIRQEPGEMIRWQFVYARAKNGLKPALRTVVVRASARIIRRAKR